MLDKETKQNLAHYLEMLESPLFFQQVQMTLMIQESYLSS